MTDIDRRTVLASLASGLFLYGPRLEGRAQASAARPNRIDVHHHFAPPAWVTAVKSRPLLQPANATWTPEKSIADMDRGGVALSLVSITNPGLWFGDAPMTRQLARACNEYGAKLVQDHPTRFGVFAAMPLPDVGVAFSGDAVKFPDVRFIWSHAGGSAPFLAARIEGASANAKDRLPNGFMAEIRKFYYDLAGASNRGAVASLLELVKSSQILFGTDFPPGGSATDYVKALSQMTLLNKNDLKAIDRDNAVRLIPRLGRV